MNFDLHADVSGLPLWKRALYGLCLIAGVCGLFLFAFVLLVEIWSWPKYHGRSWWLLLPVAFSIWHVGREVRAGGRLARTRWLLFLLATGSLAWKAWALIGDPIAAAVFAAWGMVSSGLIFIARLIARKGVSA